MLTKQKIQRVSNTLSLTVDLWHFRFWVVIFASSLSYTQNDTIEPDGVYSLPPHPPSMNSAPFPIISRLHFVKSIKLPLTKSGHLSSSTVFSVKRPSRYSITHQPYLDRKAGSEPEAFCLQDNSLTYRLQSYSSLLLWCRVDILLSQGDSNPGNISSISSPPAQHQASLPMSTKHTFQRQHCGVKRKLHRAQYNTSHVCGGLIKSWRKKILWE